MSDTVSDTDLASSLRSLVKSDDSGRSEAARLRDVYDEIEAAIASGVSLDKLHQNLLEHGFTMTKRGFETALYRIRKKRRTPSIKANVASRSAVSDPGSSLLKDEVHGQTAVGTDETTEAMNELLKDPKQKREEHANKYISPTTSNPLFRKSKS